MTIGSTSRQGSAEAPFDRRLLTYSPSARRYTIALALFAIVDVIAVIAGAVAIAGLLSDVVTDPSKRSFGAQAVHLAVIVAAFATRAATTYLRDRYAHRAALQTIAELRSAAVDALTDPARTSPHRLAAERDRASTVLLRGLDALVDYLADYVPALLSTVVITPLVIAVVWWADWPSAVIIIVTMPLIPLFMVLIGMLTRDRTRRKLDAMSTQSAQLLDLLTGLPTLKALGRANGPAKRVDALGANLTRSTMSSLRIAFLSGAVLELLATLCVALVAVGIGLRLVFGDMGLYAGVLALVLAPEAYLPLRRIGAAFHAAEDGKEASREVLELLSASADHVPADDRVRTVASPLTVTLDDLGVRGRDGWTPRHLTATLRPGEVTVLTGANGAGKSTALASILGLETPHEGCVRINDTEVGMLDLDDFHAHVAWLPQNPVIEPGTVADNLALFGDLDPDLVAETSRAVAFDAVVADLPSGLMTTIGAGGTGMSAGQRQRLALVRTLASNAPLLLLDEPTSHLDDATAARVLTTIGRRAAMGATVIVVSHRADAIDVDSGRGRIVDVAGEAVAR